MTTTQNNKPNSAHLPGTLRAQLAIADGGLFVQLRAEYLVGARFLVIVTDGTQYVIASQHKSAKRAHVALGRLAGIC